MSDENLKTIDESIPTETKVAMSCAIGDRMEGRVNRIENNYIEKSEYKEFEGYVKSFRFIADIIYTIPNLFDWERILSKYEFSTYFINDVIDKIGSNVHTQNIIPWTTLFIHQNLSIEFIQKFKHMFNWDYLIENDLCDTGTLELVDSVINKERWDLISRCMTLDQNFLHKYAHKINWSLLLVSNAKTILTEEQIEEFYHYIPTRRLIYSKSLYTLSDDFIIKHINEFSYNDMIHIIQKKVFSNEFYVEYANYYDIDVLDMHTHIPMEAVDFHLTHAIVTNKGKALRICMPCEVGEKRQHMTEEYASLILKHADKLKWSDIPEEARKEASIYFWFNFHHRKIFAKPSN